MRTQHNAAHQVILIGTAVTVLAIWAVFSMRISGTTGVWNAMVSGAIISAMTVLVQDIHAALPATELALRLTIVAALVLLVGSFAWRKAHDRRVASEVVLTTQCSECHQHLRGDWSVCPYCWSWQEGFRQAKRLHRGL